jgi:hypothetical protein
VDLLPELVALVPEQAAALESEPGLSGTTRIAPPMPWNAAAALMFYEIHGDARRFESLLTIRLSRTAKFRGGSGRHTVECLQGLPLLVEHGRASGLPDLDLVDVTQALLTWPKRVRVLLGQERDGDARPTPVPGGACCPECSRDLVLSAGWRALEANASAECPSCRDDETGRPLRWPVTELVGLPQHEELLTAEDARHRFDLSTSVLRVWKHRGRIHPYGRNDAGRPLFRVSDIRALMTAAEQP